MNSEDSMAESVSKNTAGGCLFCGQEIAIFKESVFDTRFGIYVSFNICQCVSCGLIQLLPSPSSNELKRLYETYYNFGGSKKSLYTKLRRTFLESVFYRLWMAIDGDIAFHDKKGKGREARKGKHW